METEDTQGGTGITEETPATPGRSLKPWLVGFAAVAVAGVAISATLAWRQPLDGHGRKPTVEELEQMRYDSDRQEREQRKTDSLRDQNLLLREDDSRLRFDSLMQGFGDGRGAPGPEDGEEYPEAEGYEKDEEEAIDHILREPPPVPANEPPQGDAPADSTKLPSMFAYSRASGGAGHAEPKEARSQNAESTEKASSGSDAAKTADIPQTEKKTPVVYTGLPLVTLYEGEMLEAALVNRLVADTEPSPVVCNLSRDLFDRSGRYVVLPANSRVVGTSQVVGYKGAHRLFITFHRIILPGGPSIELPSSQKAMKALDGTGALGVVSKVDRHWFMQFGTSILLGVLDGLSGAAQRNREDTLRSAVMGRTSENFDRVLENIMSQYSSIVPTIRVDQGKTLRIYLADDIVITPYARISDRSYYATR